MYNTRRMAWFFLMEHGEEFLSEWYDWETEKQPEVLDAVLPEAAGNGEVPEVPVPDGLVIPPPPAIAEPPAPDVRRSTRHLKAGGVSKRTLCEIYFLLF